MKAKLMELDKSVCGALISVIDFGECLLFEKDNKIRSMKIDGDYKGDWRFHKESSTIYTFVDISSDAGLKMYVSDCDLHDSEIMLRPDDKRLNQVIM